MKKIYVSTLVASLFLILSFGIVQAQNFGVDQPTPQEKLDVNGAIRIKDATNSNAGSIQYLSGSNKFQVNIAGTWYDLATTADVNDAYNTSFSISSNILTITDGTTSYSVDLNYLDNNIDADSDPTNEYNSSVNYNTSTHVLTVSDAGGNLTVDLSTLYQDAAHVAVTPSGNLTSTDVQAALEELQSDIDAINPDIAEVLTNGNTANAGQKLKIDQVSARNANGLLLSDDADNAGVFVRDGGNVGIGTTVPGSKLDVNGKTKTTDFQMTNGATNGYVLQSDGSGNASWQSIGTVFGSDTDPNDGLSINYPDVDLNVKNGLRLNNDSLKLGGPLTENTAVTQGNYNMAYNLTGSGDFQVQDAGVTVFHVDDDGNTYIGASSSAGNELYIADKLIDWDAPGYYLDPNGTSHVNKIGADLGGASAPSYSFDGDNNTGIYSPAADNVAIATAGTEKLSILANGNTGIGSTTPSEKLDVSGKTKTTDFQMTNGATANYILTGDGSGNASWQNPSSNPLLQDGDWNKTGGGVPAIGDEIYHSGNVGVGTTDPSAQLDVTSTGTSITGTVLSDDFLVTADGPGNTATNEVPIASFGWKTGQDGDASLGIRAYRNSDDPQNRALSTSFLLGFDVGNNVREGAYLTLSHNGNVGVGTLDPAYKLHVNGTAGLGQSYLLNSDIYFTNTSHDHTGIGNTTGYAAIENASNYNTLMILGRSGGIGGGRSVSIWDRLDVNGNLAVTGLAGSGNRVVQANSSGQLIISNDLPGSDADYIWNQYGSNQSANFDITGVGEASEYRINDSNTKLVEGGGNSIRLQTNSGYIDVGPQNSGWAHIQTNMPRFYLNTNLTVDGGLIGSYNEDLNLQTSGTTRITVLNSNGNVGIGTSPSAKFQVSGGGQILGTNGTSSNTRTLTILEDGDSQINFGSYPGAWTSALQIQNNDNSRYLWLSPLDNSSGGNARIVSVGSAFDIYPGNNFSTTYATNGNVGIGVTSPSRKLEVNGDIKLSYGHQIYLGENVSANGKIGINFHTDADPNYWIGKPAGGWTQPLYIGFYTGIKIGANTAYGGTKFYNSSNMVTELMSVGNGDNHVRVANNLYVGSYGGHNSTPTSYGSLGLLQAKNGYYGLLFGQATSNPNIMYDGAGNGGIYYQNYGWSTYYLAGNRHLQINTSSDLGATLGINGTLAVKDGTQGSGKVLVSNASGVASWSNSIPGGSGNYIWNQWGTNQSASFYISGNGQANSSLRAPIFYDSNNTGYYLDPTGTCRVSTIYCGDVYNDLGGWFRNYGQTGIYNQSYGLHWYSESQSYWTTTTPGAGGILFRDGYNGGIKGYLYQNDAGSFGLLSPDGNWKVRVDNSNTENYGTYNYLTNAQAYIMYDRNNTGYYVDPNGSSQMSSVYANNWFRPQGQTGLYFQDYGGGWYMVDGTWIRGYNNKGLYMERPGYYAYDGYSPGYRCAIFQNSTATADWVQLNYAGYSTWYANYNYGYVYATTYGYLSTRTAKHDIQRFQEDDYQSAYAFIDSLDLNYYKYNDDPMNTTRVGFIAEDVPSPLTFPGRDAVKLGELGLYSLGALKVMKKKVENLESQLRNVSDFGAENIYTDSMMVEFSQEFKNALHGADPVVVVTPSQSGTILNLKEVTSEGFTVTNPNNSSVTFSWIAMAKANPDENQSQSSENQYSESFESMLKSTDNEIKNGKRPVFREKPVVAPGPTDPSAPPNGTATSIKPMAPNSSVREKP